MSHTPEGRVAEAIARRAGIVIQVSSRAKEPISDSATRRCGGRLRLPGRERPDTQDRASFLIYITDSLRPEQLVCQRGCCAQSIIESVGLPGSELEDLPEKSYRKPLTHMAQTTVFQTAANATVSMITAASKAVERLPISL
jgi:hypothetical protein